MTATQRLSESKRRRRGFQVVELVFALPLAVLLLFAALNYGSMLMIRNALTHAVTVGAREAGKGGNIDDVVEAVNGVLAVHQIAITDKPSSGTKVAVQGGDGHIAEYGDAKLSCGRSPSVQKNEVCVTVWVHADAKKTDGLSSALPCFDFLGLCKQGFRLRASVNREQGWAARPDDTSEITVACKENTPFPIL